MLRKERVCELIRMKEFKTVAFAGFEKQLRDAGLIGLAAVGEAIGGHAAEMWFAAKRLISPFGVPFATKRRVVMRH